MYDTITLFTTSLCNLKCNYCYICKDESLAVLDKELEESYKDPYYYFNLYKEYSRENISKLKCIYLFGGEPFLKLDRVFPTLRVFIENCPELRAICIISNFTYNKTPEATEKIANLLAEYPERNFEIDLQISWDGPQDIMENQRQSKAIQLIEANLHKLVVDNFYYKPNIIVKLHVNATIEFVNLCKFLDKNYLINYIKYFDNHWANLIDAPKFKHVKIEKQIKPKLAYPYAYTKEDGILFASILKNFNLIDKEQIFNYDTINWFYNFHQLEEHKLMPTRNAFYCAYGLNNITLLPNHKTCGCIRAFTESSKSHEFIYNSLNQIDQFRSELNTIIGSDKFAIYSYAVNLVKQLAAQKQILSKYINQRAAEGAVQQVFLYHGLCYYYNILDRGNPLLIDTAVFKLWLNGALDEIQTSQLILKNKWGWLNNGTESRN